MHSVTLGLNNSRLDLYNIWFLSYGVRLDRSEEAGIDVARRSRGSLVEELEFKLEVRENISDNDNIRSMDVILVHI